MYSKVCLFVLLLAAAFAAKPAVVVLVPGFLGSEKIGGHHYFSTKFAESLQGAMKERLHDREVSVIAVDTLPTGRIMQRRDVLGDTLLGETNVVIRHLIGQLPFGKKITTIFKKPREETFEIYLVGHSTGGVDAQLLMEEASRPDSRFSVLRKRVRGVVTISAPHYGTTLAEASLASAAREVLYLLHRQVSGAGGLLYHLPTHVPDYTRELWEVAFPGSLTLNAVVRRGTFFASILADQGAIDNLQPSNMIAWRREAHNDKTAWMGTEYCPLTCFATGTLPPHASRAVYFYFWKQVTSPDSGVKEADAAFEDVRKKMALAVLDGAIGTTFLGKPDKLFGNKAQLQTAHMDLGDLARMNDGVVNTWRQVLSPETFGGLVNSDHFQVLGYDNAGFDYFEADTGYPNVPNVYRDVAAAIAGALTKGKKWVAADSNSSSDDDHT